MTHRTKRLVTAMATAAIALTLALTAGPASALVAPVTAGPPRAPGVAHLDFNGFFPTTTRIHVGDSISFSVNGFHTVTFLSGQAAPALIVPDPTKLISGKLDSAGAAFWFNGQPNLIINPAAATPAGGNTYNGEGVVNSGLPNPEGPPAPFVVKFTKAGTFTFNCLVHSGMQGVVKVLAGKGKVPSARLDRARAKAQEATAKVQALRLRSVNPGKDTVLAGNDGKGPVAWLRFFPKNLRVKAGTTVDFKLGSTREVHTITIGPSAYTAQIESTFTTPEPNPKGPPTLLVSPLAGYPSDPPPLPEQSGSNHGNGFENSGVLSNAGPPQASSVQIKFTKPGVYSYECVIHEGMDGKITVTK